MVMPLWENINALGNIDMADFRHAVLWLKDYGKNGESGHERDGKSMVKLRRPPVLRRTSREKPAASL